MSYSPKCSVERNSDLPYLRQGLSLKIQCSHVQWCHNNFYSNMVKYKRVGNLDNNSIDEKAHLPWNLFTTETDRGGCILPKYRCVIYNDNNRIVI